MSPDEARRALARVQPSTAPPLLAGDPQPIEAPPIKRVLMITAAIIYGCIAVLRRLRRAYDAAVAAGHARRARFAADYTGAVRLYAEALRQQALARMLAFPVTTGDPGGPHRILGVVSVSAEVFDDGPEEGVDLGIQIAFEALRRKAEWVGGNAVVHLALHFEQGLRTRRRRGAEIANQLLSAGGALASVSLPLLETTKSRPTRRVILTGTAVELQTGAVNETSYAFNRPIKSRKRCNA